MEKLLQVRVSNSMKNLIEKNANKKGYKKVSDYIRKLIIDDSTAEDLKEMLINE